MDYNEKIRSIEDLLAGELTTTVATELRREIDQDAELQRLLANEEELVAGIRYASRNELRAQLQEWEAQLPPIEIEVDDSPRSTGYNWKPLLVAASVSIIIALYFVFNAVTSPGVDELYQEYYEPYTGYLPVTTRGEAEDELTPLQKAVAAYEREDYKGAASQLETVETGESRDFYLAQSYMALEQAEKAIPLLEQLRDTDAQPGSSIDWYLALAYLKTEQLKEARSILEELSSSDNSYSEKASELLEDI